eukprot:55364-Pelagomonas_calceolata.AAC.4
MPRETSFAPCSCHAGGVSRLFIFSLEDDNFTASTCQAAAYHAKDLQQLHSSFKLVQHRRYTNKEAADDPLFYEKIVDEAIRMKADAVLGCELMVRARSWSGAAALMYVHALLRAHTQKEPSINITQLFHAKQYYLKALWLTTAPTQPGFAAAAGLDAAENVLSATQWHPQAHFTDAYFGTAAQYSTEFEAAFGKQPSEVAAAATATAYSLAMALKEAFELCRFPDLAGLNSNQTAPALDMDRVLFNQSAVDCVAEPGMPVTATGYEWVRYQLAKQRLDTIFGKVRAGQTYGEKALLGHSCLTLFSRLHHWKAKGFSLRAHIEFDEFRRNIAKEVVTVQVQSGVVEVSLRGLPVFLFSTHTPAGMGYLYRRRRANSLDSQLVIEPKELQIINAPEVRGIAGRQCAQGLRDCRSSVRARFGELWVIRRSSIH